MARGRHERAPTVAMGKRAITRGVTKILNLSHKGVSVPFSFKQGRPRNMCETCSHGLVAHDRDGRRITNYCLSAEREMPDIGQCSYYDSDIEEAPHWMHMRAWRLKLDEHRNFIGFRAPGTPRRLGDDD